jgi:molybdenum cofactor synthesis domain-containing protein
MELEELGSTPYHAASFRSHSPARTKNFPFPYPMTKKQTRGAPRAPVIDRGNSDSSARKPPANTLNSRGPRLSVEECNTILGTIVANHFSKMYTDRISTKYSFDTLLSEDVASTVNVPEERTSIVDGYACNLGSGITSFRIVGENVAGSSSITSLQSGQAAYVSTGGAVPHGANSVVPIENCIVDTKCNILTFKTFPDPNIDANVRDIGSDIAVGSVLAQAGRRVTAADMALFESARVKQVSVFSRLRIGVFSTGKEVAKGKIGDSNRTYLIHSLRHELGAGILVADLGAVDDDIASFQKRMNIPQYTILISSGSVSMGKTDCIKDALKESGYRILFDQVDMKPGKPTTVALSRDKRKIFFALPGNPASCFVTYNLFVVPTIKKLTGEASFELKTRIAVLRDYNTHPDPERPEYVRAITRYAIGGGLEVTIEPTGHQRSSRMASCAGDVNSLVLVKPGAEMVRKGTSVDVIILPGKSIFDYNEGAESHVLLAKAAAFDSLVGWLQERTDVENIDLMDLAGFCRNCLSNWMHQAAPGTLSLSAAKEYVYGMAYEEWKKKFRKGEKKEHKPIEKSIPPAPVSNPCASHVMPARMSGPPSGPSSVALIPFEVIWLCHHEMMHAADEMKPTGLVGKIVTAADYGLPVKKPVYHEIPCDTDIPFINDPIDLSPRLVIVCSEMDGVDFTIDDIQDALEKESIGLMHLVQSEIAKMIDNPEYNLLRSVIGTIGGTIVVALPQRREIILAALNVLQRPLAVLIAQFQKQFDEPKKKKGTIRRPIETRRAPMGEPMSPISKTFSVQLHVVTVSDRAFEGIYRDESGPLVERFMLESGLVLSDNVSSIILPDDTDAILENITHFKLESGVGVIVLTGGTGHSFRDITPEAIGAVLDYPIPGMVHLLLSKYIEIDPAFALCRPTIGVMDRCIVVSLPGRPEAVEVGLKVLFPPLVALVADILEDRLDMW